MCFSVPVLEASDLTFAPVLTISSVLGDVLLGRRTRNNFCAYLQKRAMDGALIVFILVPAGGNKCFLGK